MNVIILTDVLHNIRDGGLEELVHGFLAESQHALRRPLDDVHTGTHKELQSREETFLKKAPRQIPRR